MKMRTILAAFALLVAVPAMPGLAPDVAQAQTIAYAERGTTNLRAGPGIHFAVIGKVYGGSQLLVHDSQGGWYYVTASGQRGWMAGSRLRFAYARAPAPQPYYVPVVPRPYVYRGPSFSFRFGDFDRDRRWHRSRDRRDWNRGRGRGDNEWRWRRRGDGDRGWRRVD